LLKDSDEPLWDGCTNHSKLSVVAQVFTIKSDHGLSKARYDKIIEWAKSILLEGNKLKENYYGRLEEVIKLQYHNEQNRVFLFKCYWYEMTDRGIRVDLYYGLVEINSKTPQHKRCLCFHKAMSTSLLHIHRFI
jgi:hypothetical protein